MNHSKRVNVPEPFHKRFNIDVKLEEGQRRFLERVRTATQMALLDFDQRSDVALNRICEIACFKMGVRPQFVMHLMGSNGFMAMWDKVVADDFITCLRMTEAVSDATGAIDNN